MEMEGLDRVWKDWRMESEVNARWLVMVAVLVGMRTKIVWLGRRTIIYQVGG